MKFEYEEEDKNICMAIMQLDHYGSRALFSKEAQLMKTNEFAIMMRDFADLSSERRGLFFDVLPFMTYFKDKYYKPYVDSYLQDRDIRMYPEFLHFASHEQSMQAILSFLGYEGAEYKVIHPAATLTFEFFRVQYAKKKGEKAIQSETHIQVLLNTFDEDDKVVSELLHIRECDNQASGGVKAQCFY